jgi:hypothetical protein
MGHGMPGLGEEDEYRGRYSRCTAGRQTWARGADEESGRTIRGELGEGARAALDTPPFPRRDCGKDGAPVWNLCGHCAVEMVGGTGWGVDERINPD